MCLTLSHEATKVTPSQNRSTEAQQPVAPLESGYKFPFLFAQKESERKDPIVLWTPRRVEAAAGMESGAGGKGGTKYKLSTLRILVHRIAFHC